MEQTNSREANSVIKFLRFAPLVALAVIRISSAYATDVEFQGTPILRIDVANGLPTTQVIRPNRAREFDVVILRTDVGYVWASRNNLAMEKIDAISYVTYVAKNGSGYVRVLSPLLRKILPELPAELREREFVYMEHLVHQLGSITYYGK